jgi:hypothetical protein
MTHRRTALVVALGFFSAVALAPGVAVAAGGYSGHAGPARGSAHGGSAHGGRTHGTYDSHQGGYSSRGHYGGYYSSHGWHGGHATRGQGQWGHVYTSGGVVRYAPRTLYGYPYGVVVTTTPVWVPGYWYWTGYHWGWVSGHWR